MKLNEYQIGAHATALYPPEEGLMYTALGLASEAGEYAGKVKRKIRDKKFDKREAAAELGDVLWYVAEACTVLGIKLEDVAEENLAKLRNRALAGTLKGQGDNR